MKYPLIAMFCTYTIFAMSNTFSNLFINIYLWKQHPHLSIVGFFQFVSFAFTFVGIICGALLIRYAGSRVNFITSSVLALLLYVFLASGIGEWYAQVLLGGVLNGLYIGLFFAGMNFYSLWFSDRQELTGVISLQYIINGIVQLSVPPIAGWVIHFKGYEISFLTAIGILMVQTMCSVATPQVRIRKSFRRKGFFIPENKKIAFLGLSAASYGFFFAFVQMSASVLIFLFVQRESTLGNWNMLFAFLTILTYFILNRSKVVPYRDLIGTLGVVISTVVTLSLFAQYPASFIVFNAIVSVSLPMMWIPAFTRQLSTIKKQVEFSKANPLTKMMELIVFREFSLCVGRLSFLTVLILSVSFIHSQALFIVIFLLSFMPVSLFLLSKRAEYPIE